MLNTHRPQTGPSPSEFISLSVNASVGGASANHASVNETSAAATLSAPAGSFRSGLPAPKNGARYRVAIYERVSRPTSVTGSHTFETQMPRIVEMLDRRLGSGRYEVVCFGEDGQSGGLGPAPTGTQRRVRPDLVRLKEALETRAFDFLAFYSSDRFMRNARWFLQFVEDVLFPTQTTALSATEEMDLTSANGFFSSAMIAVVNDFYRRSGSARLVDASATRRAAGFWVGPPPYGWRRQPRDPDPRVRPGIEPNPDTAPVVHRIKDRYLEGANIVTIARELNDDGVPSAGGGLWSGETVWRVVCHPAHAGLMWSQPRGQGELVPGQHFGARLYEREDYDAILGRRERRVLARRTNSARANSPHLLNGLAHCRRCGHRLTVGFGSRDAASGGYLYRYYRCPNGANRGARTCTDVTANAEVLEDALGRELERLCADADLREILREEAQIALDAARHGARHDAGELARREEELRARRARLVDAFARGILAESDFVAGCADLDAEATRLAGQRAQSENVRAGQQDLARRAAQLEAAFDRLSDHWPALPNDERREVMELLLERLEVDCHGRDIALFLRFVLGEEREVLLARPSANHRRNCPSGVDALTPRQLAFLWHYNAGLRTTAIAAAMGISAQCGARSGTDIRKRLGVQDLQTAADLAAPRIAALLDSLPLGLSNHHRRGQSTGARSPFTEKNLEVLRPLSQGYNQAQVARDLGVSQFVVSTRKKRLFNALCVNSVPQAAQLAREQGLL